jgi:hypothetical protein
MRILSKVLVVCVILVAACAADRNAAMNRSISRGSLAEQGTETATKFPIGVARDPEASPVPIERI